VISYPLKLKFLEKPTVLYKTEAESKEINKPPCEGTPEKPLANEGFLCVYTGGNFGAQESEQEEAKFFGVVSPTAGYCESAPGVGTCKAVSESGALLLYRTNGFKLEAGRGPALTKEAYLTVFGGWAVRSK
jgi:hypothetical protein